MFFVKYVIVINVIFFIKISIQQTLKKIGPASLYSSKKYIFKYFQKDTLKCVVTTDR